MFFDAFGRLAFGQDTQAAAVSYALPAVAGVYPIAGTAVAFGGAEVAPAGIYRLGGARAAFGAAEPASAGAYALTGRTIGETVSLAPAPGSHWLSGVATTVAFKEIAGADAYALTGTTIGETVAIAAAAGAYASAGFGVTVAVTMPGDGGVHAWTLTPTPLIRTGDDFDQVYGGVGHYLEELEEKRRLARITRKTPAPIQTKAWPALPPIIAQPPRPAPAIDPQAIAAQWQAEQKQVDAAARRRQALEILLLAS